jgi:hypothetical protein
MIDPMEHLFGQREKIENLANSIKKYYAQMAYHTDTLLTAMELGTTPEEFKKSALEAFVGLGFSKTNAEELFEILSPCIVKSSNEKG